MKKILFAFATLFLFSCAPKGDTDKRAELLKYKELIQEYTLKIEELENEIMDSDEVHDKNNRATSVEIKELRHEEFSSYFEAKGSLESLNDAYISPEISGQIKTISVQRGQRVIRGDLLIVLKTDVTQNTIDEVKTSLELANVIFSKQQQLWEKNIGSELQFLEAKNGKESLEARLATLESQLAMASIRAPFNGIIEDIMVKTGELASPGMRLMRVVNLDEMMITAHVSESYISKIQKGHLVKLTFPSLPGIVLSEPIERVGSVIDPVTRTFSIEVLVKNKNEVLKPNMLSSVLIQDYYDESALLVPSIILKQDFSGTFLYRVAERGSQMVAEKVYVVPGKTVQEITKINNGLNVNDKIIVKGYNLVTDGEYLQILN